MGGQELDRLPAPGPGHVPPQGHALPGVEARPGHELQPHQVRLGLMAAAVGQQDPHLRAEAQHRHQPSPLRRFPRSRQRCRRRHAGLHHELAGHAFVAVPGEDVPDLVADHHRELVLRLRHVEEALVHADLPARQGERVGLVPIEHPDLPALGFVAGQGGHDGVRDTLHVAAQERTGGGGLGLDLVERRRAHVPHGGRREEGELIAPGGGGRAARGGQRGHDEEGGTYPFHDLSGLRSCTAGKRCTGRQPPDGDPW